MVVQYQQIRGNEALIINDIGRCASCHPPGEPTARHDHVYMRVMGHRIRTKEGLARAKARGVKLGGTNEQSLKQAADAKAFAESLRPLIEELAGAIAQWRRTSPLPHSETITNPRQTGPLEQKVTATLSLTAGPGRPGSPVATACAREGVDPFLPPSLRPSHRRGRTFP
jgi:hypothetical protein